MNAPPARYFLAPDRLARAAGYRRIAGVDEAGCGPWAGPVIAAAVVLQRRRRLPVRIGDSKCLTLLQRERAYAVILEYGEVGVGVADAAEIDRHNILQARLLAMRRALDDLPQPAELALIDGTVSPAAGLACWPCVDGDARSYLIGCASIIAKVTRDRMMRFYHRLAPRYAFHRHKGYGTPLHLARLLRFGPCSFHRQSVRPVYEAVRAE